LEDFAARGSLTVFVEAGAEVCESLPREDLVDRFVLLTGQGLLMAMPVNAPVTADSRTEAFRRGSHP